MNPTDTVKTTIWEDGDVTEMARFQINGANATQSDITAITRHIFDVSGLTPDTDLDGAAVAVASTVFDALQTDGYWTKDPTGYNFRNRVPATMFVTGGHTYRVEYAFTGSGGEKFKMVFEHPAKNVRAS